MEELRPGLWRWTSAHPDWEPDPEPESPGDWPERVGCVAYAAADSFLLIDPLVRDEAIWRRLDELVESHGKPVVTFVTIPFHRRSDEEVARRYGASPAAAAPAEGIEAIEIRRGGETMVWLPESRALVPGDRLLGDGRGGLRICPDSWLGYLENGLTGRELRDTLREQLLGLPTELVLVSHGEPVLERGGDAIEQALGA